MYGTQAVATFKARVAMFENDVKMYGTQAKRPFSSTFLSFENDVKMYGTQAQAKTSCRHHSLRMM